MNNAIMLGNLVRDPENRMTSGGVSVTTFSIAVNRKFSKEKEVDFHNVVTWRALADSCVKYLSKGSKVCVQGQLQNRSYETSDGQKRYVTEIIASEVEFLDPAQNRAQGRTDGQDEYGDPVDDEDLPF